MFIPCWRPWLRRVHIIHNSRQWKSMAFRSSQIRWHTPISQSISNGSSSNSQTTRRLLGLCFCLRWGQDWFRCNFTVQSSHLWYEWEHKGSYSTNHSWRFGWATSSYFQTGKLSSVLFLVHYIKNFQICHRVETITFWSSMVMGNLISITAAVLQPWTMLYKLSKKGRTCGQEAYTKQSAVATVSYNGRCQFHFNRLYH